MTTRYVTLFLDGEVPVGASAHNTLAAAQARAHQDYNDGDDSPIHLSWEVIATRGSPGPATAWRHFAPGDNGPTLIFEIEDQLKLT